MGILSDIGEFIGGLIRGVRKFDVDPGEPIEPVRRTHRFGDNLRCVWCDQVRGDHNLECPRKRPA